MKKFLSSVLLLVFCATVSFAQVEANKVIPETSKISKTSSAKVASYDFTTNASKFYGGTNGAKEIEAGVWGMIAGDANGDGGIYAEDYTAYQTNQGSEGYQIADFNMDGGVYAEDYTIYQLNQGKETSVPQ